MAGAELNDDKEPMGRRFSMTDFVNPSPTGGDLVAHLVKLTKGGAYYTFDATGNVGVIRTALKAAHKDWGESIVIGVAPAGAKISTRPFQLVTGRSCRGTAFGGARGRTAVALSRSRAAAGARLGHVPRKGDPAFPTQC